jgi:AcrR family transcriptional regulator
MTPIDTQAASEAASRQLLPREQRRESILRAAARAFARAGYAATSMEDVAAEAGITRLIVYRHFASKEDLYRAVLDGISTRLRDEFDAQLQERRLGFTSRAMLEVARAEPDAVRLLWVHAVREPEFVDYALRQRQDAVDVANDLIGDHIADPAVKTWIAETIVHYLVAGVLSWLDHGDPARDEEFIDLATRGLVGMFTAWVEEPGEPGQP